MRAMRLTVVVAAWLLTACASAATGSGGSSARNVVTREQLEATNSETLYDAINKLRPEWLSTRGPTSVTDPSPTMASVYMNGTLLGRAEALKDMRILDVTEVRYWDAGSASARFGMGHPRGVIEITRK